MSKANAEQILAIEHQGGMLLKAGAGSGKTFVLVEHIIYLTNNWIQEFKASPQGTFEDFIRLRFTQVVMMTFTKKAAGEMSIRLTDKFSSIAEQSNENQNYWQIASEALPLLTVTTIDGFCRRLITSGFFPHLSTEAKIIFTTERLDQVQALFERWFESNSQGWTNEILEIVIREKKQLLNALSNIFSDPSLRLEWKKFNFSEAHPTKLGDTLQKSFKLNKIEEALLRIHQFDLPVESERSAFETVVGQLQNTGLPVVDSLEKLEVYSSFFAGIKVLRGESGKKKTPQHEEVKDAIVEVRDWIKKWFPVISDYSAHYDTKILPWLKLCQSAFEAIDKGLDPNQGMTFGDIEYYVALGLKNKEDLDRIQKTYQYFIVDEFQDTSSLQFEIIQGLIGKDYKKLFCVGDAKQAIYGFRGGELSVFQDCAELVPVVRTLANNYRSLPSIIKFNNSLFRHVLPLGQEFTGLDPFTVEAEDQNIPSEVNHEQEGSVEILKTTIERNVEEEGKLSTDEINRLEAILLSDSIEKQRKMFPQETCTVLYRKLKPSGELIRSLIKKNIGFTAQFKIDLIDDPVMGIFLVLLKRQFDINEKTHDHYPLMMIKSYLKILEISNDLNQAMLKKFDEDVMYWGLLEAFKKFIFHLNITNENSDINLEVIETLCKLYHQDPETILVQLSQGDNSRISLDFRYGADAGRVQLMTAHASKGLEFDTVYLAGIYTNGRENPDRDMFGDHPGSFYWYLDLANREKQKSPFFLFESEINKYKNFSESKRLFYVAATRAKRKLVWVDLGDLNSLFSIPKNSWIDGLNSWLLHSSASGINLEESKDNEFDSSLVLKQENPPELPLFFYDSVGVQPKSGEKSDLGIVAELSVTRLNSLVDCPRKFYLENILKLTATASPQEFRSRSEEEVTGVVSSAQRGTMVHEFIAKGIERNFVVPREAFSGELKEPIQWALDELQNYRADYDFIAEKPLKFEFFNFMISGIPDLLLMPKTNDKLAQVWDFKTGRITQENLAHYWIQLAAYAYALYQTGQLRNDTKIELKLCFVDEKKILERSIDLNTAIQELYPVWISQNEPWTIKTDHCTQCPYGDICPR